MIKLILFTLTITQQNSLHTLNLIHTSTESLYMKLLYEKWLVEMMTHLYVEHKSSSIPSVAFTRVSGVVRFPEMLHICKCFWTDPTTGSSSVRPCLKIWAFKDHMNIWATEFLLDLRIWILCASSKRFTICVMADKSTDQKKQKKQYK